MARSFDIVDFKLAESVFFFERLEMTTDLFEAQYLMSAFASACRSVTFAMQASLADLEGFQEWYQARQAELRVDDRARYFNEIRRLSEHVGLSPIVGFISSGGGGRRFFLHDLRHPFGSRELPLASGLDAISEARAHLVTLLGLVEACYLQFGNAIDPQLYFTAENFARLGLSIEDAEEEIVGIRGWTEVPGGTVEERWKVLRSQVPIVGIEQFREKYLANG